ncbi:MAG: hypothetical protein ACXWGT_06110 [Usitatibacter sp.]
MKTRLASLFHSACALLAAFAAASAGAFLINIDVLTVDEYVNDVNGHYFLVADPNEKAALDRSGYWHPTGHSFSAYVSYAQGHSEVCRFYAPGPDTHFFTADPRECDGLRRDGLGWNFEGVPFRIDRPVDGACAALHTPVYRLYNNRFAFNDSNHRYVADPDLRADLVRQGWIDEGVVFCPTFASFAANKTFGTLAAAVRPVAECTNEDLNIGSCIATNNLPVSLTTHIVGWAPPFYVTRGPQWSQSYFDMTGFDGDVYTSQSGDDTGAVLAHSFIQSYFPASPTLGVRVSPLDAAGPLASIEPVYQFSTRAPAAGAQDARVFPWRAPRENRLELSFGLYVKTARRSDAQSHAYGAPMIEFRDTRSGFAVDVTMLTFATFPPGEFVGQMDPVTGNVIVSTAFWDHPMFGTRVSGDFIPLGGDVAAPSLMQRFLFRITPDDFAKILAMAKTTNPALSRDPKDYLLVNIRFRNGVLGNAELGATLDNFAVSLYGY